MAKHKIKRVTKKAYKAWRRHRKPIVAARKKARTKQRTAAQKKLAAQKLATPKGLTFTSRHPFVAAVRDFMADQAHGVLDRRDAVGGIITQEEWERFEVSGGEIETWRTELVKQRKEARRVQRGGRRSEQYKPLTVKLGTSSAKQTSSPMVAVPAGWRPPKPRTFTPPVKVAGKRHLSVVPRRPARAVRGTRPAIIAKAWAPYFEELEDQKMASGTLASAVSTIKTFAETLPVTQQELEDFLAELAALGQGLGEAFEAVKATLERGNEPQVKGLPSEVTNHLSPLTEVGSEITNATRQTWAAWNDRFGQAIAVARDEDKPTDEFLRNQRVSA